MTTAMTNDEAGAVARETNARVSARAVTPLPPDLEEQLSARVAEQDRIVGGMLATPDGDIAGVFAAAPDWVRQVAAPYRERRAAIREEHAAGILTNVGAQQRDAALGVALAAELDEKVFGPLGRRVEAAAQRYTAMSQTKPSIAEDREAGRLLASELRLLSPQRGLARAAEVIRDAAAFDNRGVARAVIPFLQSLIEDSTSPYGGSLDLLDLVRKAENAMGRDPLQDVAEHRLYEISMLQYQMSGLRESALETAGDLNQSLRFRLSDFARGELRQPSFHPGMPGYERLERARQAASRAYRGA